MKTKRSNKGKRKATSKQAFPLNLKKGETFAAYARRKTSRKKPEKSPVQLSRLSVDELHQLVSEGLPATSLAEFIQESGLEPAVVLSWVGIQSKSISGRSGKLTLDQSDRLVRAIRLFRRVLDLHCGDTKMASHWLTTPKLGLGDVIPLEFARTDVGTREVEDLIHRIECGIPT